jgi:hypothetical protein
MWALITKTKIMTWLTVAWVVSLMAPMVVLSQGNQPPAQTTACGVTLAGSTGTLVENMTTGTCSATITVTAVSPSIGPPLYLGSSTSQANPGTIYPIFNSLSVQNSTALDTSITPSGCITLIANQTVLADGGSMAGTASDGDNDEMSSSNETYMAAFGIGGAAAILHVNTSGPCMQVVNTGLAGIVLPSPALPGHRFIGFSHRMVNTRFYAIANKTQLWQDDITSDTTATKTELVDLTATGVCPGINWSTFGTPDWTGTVTYSMDEDTFSWSVGPGAQQSADWWFIWSKTKGCETINLHTGKVWDFCKPGSCSPSTPPLGTLSTTSKQCWGSQGAVLHGIHNGRMNLAGTWVRIDFTGGGWTQGGCNGNTTTSQSTFFKIGTLEADWAYNESDRGMGGYDFDGHPSDGINNVLGESFNAPGYNVRPYTDLRAITSFYPHISNVQDFHGAQPHPTGDDSYPWVLASDSQLVASNSGCLFPAQCPTRLQNVVYSINPTLPVSQPVHVFFHTYGGNPIGPLFAHGPSGVGDFYFGAANSIGFVTSKGNFFCWASTVLQNMGTDAAGHTRSVLLCGRLI